MSKDKQNGVAKTEKKKKKSHKDKEDKHAIPDLDVMEIDQSKDLSIEASKSKALKLSAADGESRALHKLLKRAHNEVLKAMDKGTDTTGGQPDAMQELLDLVKNPEYDTEDVWKPLHYVMKRWNQFSLHKRHFLRYASPLGRDCQTIKVYKLITLGANAVRLARGVKEVEKAINRLPEAAKDQNLDRHDPPALLVLAADTHPDEILMHLPVFAEEHNVPTIYVTSRQVLGRMAKTKRATSAVLIHKEPPNRKANSGDKLESAEFDQRYKTVAHMMVRLSEQLDYKQPGFTSEWPDAKRFLASEENQLRKLAQEVEAMYIAAGKREEFQEELAKGASELVAKGIDPAISEPQPFDEAALIAAAKPGPDVPAGYRSVDQDLAEMALQFDRPIPEHALPKPLFDPHWVSSDSEDPEDDEWEWEDVDGDDEAED